MRGVAYTPEQVAVICDEFCDRWPKADGGPAHIVLSDYNFEDCFLKSCINNIKQKKWCDGHSLEELQATNDLLVWLLMVIPEAERVFPNENDEGNVIYDY